MDDFVDESHSSVVRELPRRPAMWRRCLSVIMRLLTVIMFAALIAGFTGLLCFWPVVVGFFLDHFVAFGKTGG